MSRLILVTGGARSGKSTFAERLLQKLAPQGGTYVATAEAHDDEMQERIRLHQAQREASGYGWHTANCPLQLPEWLTEADGAAVLIDCLTLWLSNELLQAQQESGEGPELEQRLDARIDELLDVLAEVQGTVVVVTNEVGSGVVPAYKLGRIFRDAAGRLNQRLAARADEVYLVTAGIPIEIKSRMVQL